MSCFWDSLRRKIPQLNHCKSPEALLAYLQTKNVYTPHVKWQGQSLSPKIMKENYITVKNYHANVRQGHLTSSCDPFLCLVCEICQIHINFTFVKSKITYVYDAANEVLKTYNFQSTNSHFS